MVSKRHAAPRNHPEGDERATNSLQGLNIYFNKVNLLGRVTLPWRRP